MNIIYAKERLPRSIFLAGPTPREAGVRSWRRDAVKILEELGFEGDVFVPETRDGVWAHEYHDQVFWEWRALARASVIAFWVPRDLETLPGFTTNVEFGHYVSTGKCLLGYPKGAPKTRYLKQLGLEFNVEVHHTLRALLTEAVNRA